MRASVLSAAVLFSALFSQTSEASPQWSTPVSGCAVASFTTANAPTIDAQYGEVDFTGTDTGTVTLVCPVTNLVSVSTLSFTYNDQGTGCSMSASLLFHNLTTATSGSLATSTASAGASGNAYLKTTASSFGSTPLDFSTNFYWTEVIMTRTSGTVTYCSANAVYLGT